MSLEDKRIHLLEKLEEYRESKVLLYVAGNRPGFETVIQFDALDHLTRHLEIMSHGEKIPRLSLFLYTRGGDILAAWNIVNLLREYCDFLEVIVPAIAHGAGTLICLGSSRIVMTKRSSLSSIDPMITTPLNPLVSDRPGNRMPVSVKVLNGYIQFVKDGFGVKDERALAAIINTLSDKIHPLVLGEAYLEWTQIQKHVRELLGYHLPKTNKIISEEILKHFLEESGSINHIINLSEAKKIGLNVEEAINNDRDLINAVLVNVIRDLQLNEPFDPIQILNGKQTTNITATRATIQSVDGGVVSYVTDARIELNDKDENDIVKIIREYEGWRF